jgi:hypothetical protein
MAEFGLKSEFYSAAIGSRLLASLPSPAGQNPNPKKGQGGVWRILVNQKLCQWYIDKCSWFLSSDEDELGEYELASKKCLEKKQKTADRL